MSAQRQSPVVTTRYRDASGEIRMRVSECRVCETDIGAKNGATTLTHHLEGSPECRARICEWLDERGGR